MIHWMYFVPIWLSGVLCVLVVCAFGITGLLATRRWVPALHDSPVGNNDIVGYFLNTITVLYGITLGLLTVGDWSSRTETQEKVDHEASALAAFYLDVSHYPEPHRERLQDDLRKYIREVIDVAWPEQQRGIIQTGDVATIATLANDLADFEPASEEQKILHQETYNRFNELVERRRSRLLGVRAGLSGALWALIFIGAAITIAVTWCFNVRNRRMHLWMTVLSSSLLGLMIFLLSAMDHPYLGPISVSLEPFKIIYEDLMKPGASAPDNRAPSAAQTPVKPHRQPENNK
ncbi:MAG: DUF4239 domain-containing protein [Bryobacterales bacterium]|nr:DUF4239 domain-containing protein [Bryobacterales bacterium]MBV9398971.1 DUF4239 domain-containing protein [Bryobacterales bacterium]